MGKDESSSSDVMLGIMSLLFLGYIAVVTTKGCINSARHADFVNYAPSQVQTRDLDDQGRERFIDIGEERFYAQRDGLSLQDLFEEQGYRITTTQPASQPSN